MPSPQYHPAYLAGVRLFNQREFFESHEVLEDVWNDCPLAARDFYQGLIQSAVAILHFENANVWGARKLYHSSRRYLEPYQPHYLGLDVCRFLKAMGHCFAPLLETDAGGPIPKLDAARIPVIRLDPPPGPAPSSEAQCEKQPDG